MAAHPFDRIQLKVALPTLLILAGLTLTSVYDLPYCWAPAHFTGAMVAYTRNTCGNNLTKTNNYQFPFPVLSIHLFTESFIAIAVYILSVHVSSYVLPSSSLVRMAWKDVINGRQVALPLKNQLTNLVNNHGIAVQYFLTQIAALACWIGAGITSGHSSSRASTDRPLFHPDGGVYRSNVFICEFEVRMLGNIRRYSVQCEPPTYDFHYLAVLANYTLCFLMAAFTIIHLLHTFVVSPLIQKRNAAMLMQGAGEAPVKLGVGFGFTSLHMVTVLCPMSTAVAKLEDAEGNEEIEMWKNKKLYPYVPSDA